MCGRYTLHSDAHAIADLARSLGGAINAIGPVKPRYNIAPTQMAHVIVSSCAASKDTAISARGQPLQCQQMAFGFRPHFMSHGVINARAETVLHKPLFCRALHHQRCLIFASGFYEWRKLANGRKQPFFFALRHGEVFVFAGLYRATTPKDPGHPTAQHEFVIVTTTANGCVAEVHPRMPVMLDADSARMWLAPHTEPPAAHDLLVPYPASPMFSRMVSPQVNQAGIDHPGCIMPLTSEA